MTMATLAKSQCGQFILDKYNSRNEVSRALIREAMSKIYLGERTYVYTAVDLKEVVGHSLVVSASWQEEIIYAKRPENNYLSRFVRNKEPQPTSLISLFVLRLRGSNEWILQNSHYGDVRLPEIEYTTEVSPTQEQFDYWNNNAFCWGYLSVTPGTLTTTCPWEP